MKFTGCFPSNGAVPGPELHTSLLRSSCELPEWCHPPSDPEVFRSHQFTCDKVHSPIVWCVTNEICASDQL